MCFEYIRHYIRVSMAFCKICWKPAEQQMNNKFDFKPTEKNVSMSNKVEKDGSNDASRTRVFVSTLRLNATRSTVWWILWCWSSYFDKFIFTFDAFGTVVCAIFYYISIFNLVLGISNSLVSLSAISFHFATMIFVSFPDLCI